MACLELRRDSRWWYGRYRARGKSKVVNLGVEIRGHPPTSIRGVGDARFENSRGEARAALDKLVAGVTGKQRVERLAQEVYEARMGTRVGSVALRDMPGNWDGLPRRRQPTPRYMRQATSKLHRFTRFATAQHGLTAMHEVTEAVAAAFMREEEQRGVSPRTYNDTLETLRHAFRALGKAAGLAGNPFEAIPTKASETIHRVPYTPEELKRILDAAESDPSTKPLIVVAVTTAMRLGDICQLRWRNVDMSAGFVTVKTSKTGETVDIPILPLLGDVLRQQYRGEAGPDDFVFPRAADQYQANQTVLTARLRRILATAGFHDGTRKHDTGECIDADGVPEKELREKAKKVIAQVADDIRRQRMARTLDLYLSGRNIKQIGAELGVAHSLISRDLNQIEAETGIAFIRGRRRGRTVLARAIGAVQSDREHGCNRASLRDWHSFRVSWVTIALTNGLPLELVKRITGHRTTDVVLKHYLRPQREHLRQALSDLMPKMLTGGQSWSPVDHAITILEAATPGTWREAIASALKILRGTPPNRSLDSNPLPLP